MSTLFVNHALNSSLTALAIATFAVLQIGCDSSDPASLELPLVEPQAADQVDDEAIAKFQSRRSGNSDSTEDWPALFGPHRTSATSASINPIWSADGPALLWDTEVGTGYGSPAMADGKVIFNHRIGDEEIVQCHLANDGKLMWEHRYPTTASCDYEYSDGPYSTPLIDAAGGRVYNVGGQSQIMCLSLESGQEIWNRDLGQEYSIEPVDFPIGASPILDGDQLLFNLGAGDQQAGVISLDASTGETNWTATDHGITYCSPFVTEIHRQRFGFFFTDIGLVCLDPDTGETDWVYEHFSRSPLSYNAVSPLVHGDQVLFATGPGPGAVCLKVLPDRSYEEAWKNRRIIDCQYNTLMLKDGFVYAFTAAGQGGAELRCVDLATGDLRWKYHSVLRRGQGLIAGDAIILLGERGHLASLVCTPDEPNVLSFTKEPLMDAPCYCSPAVAEGRLALKNENRVAVFSLESHN